MGRFVYQPISEDLALESKHGQLIANVYNGHVSVNHNNVINSATKRIEGKLNDVFQLENNILEQLNVVDNLEKDYSVFSSEQLEVIYDDVFKTVSNVSTNRIRLDFLIKGVGLTPDDPSTLNTVISAINDNLSSSKFSNAEHSRKIDMFETSLMRIDKLISTTKNDIENEYAEIKVLKSRINGKLEGVN